MTMLTAGMLRDHQTPATRTTATQTKPRMGALGRLRSRLTGGAREIRRTAAGRPTGTLLHDVALGGTAASAANSYLKALATGRRA